MGSRYEEIDLSGYSAQSVEDRVNKVDAQQFGKPAETSTTFSAFIDSLPDVLAAHELRELVDAIAGAHLNGKPVIASMGAHVIKCGLSPVVIDLMRRGVVTAVATNGAGAIHDSEIALFGSTSENVGSGLQDGTFGASSETAGFLNGSALDALSEGLGFGESLGRGLVGRGAPLADKSILAAGFSLGIPITVHVALGTDITHMHPGAHGSAYGDASLRDFRILTAAMKGLGGGGVVLNLGSAVILPEVVLKAFAVLRNLGYDLSGMVGANLDFIQHYRSRQQIVNRVEAMGGKGFALTGHHEIMIPLLAHAVLDKIVER